MLSVGRPDGRTFLILGGYGSTGKCIARLLLEETDLRIVLAGRDLEKAERAADELNGALAGGRVSAARADAANVRSLEQAFEGVDFVLVASTTAQYTKEVAGAALAAGIDYLDILYPAARIPVLQSMAGEIEKAGRCFVTEAGFHPGLVAAMVRYVAPGFDRLDRAIVSSLLNPEGGLPIAESVYELVESFKDYQALVFKEGEWRKVGWLSASSYRKADFGRFGVRYCAPMMLEEMRAVPEMFPALKEFGFYVSGFNWFTDWLIAFVMIAALKIWPRRAVKPMGKLLCWGIRNFSRPPYGVVLKVEAAGEKEGKPHETRVSLFHPDGYMLTAIPVAAFLLRYLDGSARKPGLWMMGHLADPTRLIDDMKRMGIEVSAD